MKDKLEKLIENNREHVDQFEPREGLWDAIDNQLGKEKQRNPYRIVLAAASVVLLISVSAWWASTRNDNSVVTTGYEKDNTTDTLAINSTVPDSYYAGVIETKRNELFTYCSSQPVLCNEFKKDLDTLNLHYMQLKKQFQTAPDKEVVLQAMMNNLQLQLQVLSQQLSIIQQAQSKKTKKELS